MTNRWSIVNEKGQVVKAGATSSTRDIPSPKEGERLIRDAEIDGRRFWVDGIEVKPRPSLRLPGIIEGRPNEEIHIGDLPKGTRVYWNDIEAGTASGRLTYKSSKAKDLSLKLVPPFPAKPMTILIYINNTSIAERNAAAKAALKERARQDFTGLDS